MTMQNTGPLTVPKWPFFAGDACMVALAAFIYFQGKGPLAPWEILALGACVTLGVLLAVLPFIMEYRGLVKLVEADKVGSAVEKIRNLETIAAQVGNVSNLWQNAQEQADKTVSAARQISDQMNSELGDFKDFLQKANESEKGNLRLEVEKLRRAEGEWLQMVVRILDHVFALASAAQRSGQQPLIAQIERFQTACRDTARRIGLVPILAKPSEAFDPQRHKWADGENPGAGATVSDTIATGFTFQGKVIRPVLVRLVQEGMAAPEESAAAAAPVPVPAPDRAKTAESAGDQSQLPLEPTGSRPLAPD
jgi:molecular chaperone GrpE (heat shock protein)